MQRYLQVHYFKHKLEEQLTGLSEAGLPLRDIQALARHSDGRTTEGYITEDDERRARAARKLQELWRGE